MLNDNNLFQHKLIRVFPHIVDTILLAAAISLTIMIQQYPFVNHWLTIKVVFLVIYIMLGVIALRLGKTKQQRTLALVLAGLCFAFIASVAHYHHPAGIFSRY